MLEPLALRGDRCGQRGVVDDRDLEPVEQAREILRRHARIAVDLDRQLGGTQQLLGNRGQRVVGIDEQGAQ